MLGRIKMTGQRFISMIFVILALSWISACGISSPKDAQTVSTESTLPKINDTKPITQGDDTLEVYEKCQSKPSAQVNQACKAQNGIMKQVGIMGCYMCVVPYSDAGKTCQDVSDCQGTCRTKPGEFLETGMSGVSGECSKNNVPFGCYQTILKGMPQSALCVD